ncbi:MAG: sigma-70 family RNA polymerase sigma factor [Solobacterium sp.]|nr:sigma-70 family RNA polymerase sigma factor [Solobacterium sp.]
MNKPAFEQVYLENYSYVYNYVYMRLLHRENAEDVVSTVFTKAMTHYDSYDSSRSGIRTWLCNIARNAVTDFFRLKSNQAHVDIDTIIEPGIEDEYNLLEDSVNQKLYRILSHLPDSEREFLALRYQKELSNDEIGNILGISGKAVSERYRRLLKKCRKIAEEYHINGDEDLL